MAGFSLAQTIGKNMIYYCLQISQFNVETEIDVLSIFMNVTSIAISFTIQYDTTLAVQEVKIYSYTVRNLLWKCR